MAAFLCRALRSPIFSPARGTIVVGRFDHFIRCAASLNSNSTFDRCPSSSELRKAFALATILEATLKELCAGASPQHRTAARTLFLLSLRRVVLTIGDLPNKGTAMLSRQDDASLGECYPSNSPSIGGTTKAALQASPGGIADCLLPIAPSGS